jgi:hypothetical protein
MIEEVRRVVMGEPAPGKSEFSHVETVEPFELGDGRVWLVWGWDELPRLPHHSTDPYVPSTYFPAPGGMRISATRFGITDADQDPVVPEELVKLSEAEPCGRVDDPARPGMHRTDSIDIGVVVAGEVIVEAGDGRQVALRPGDVYIQNGAMHNWHASEPGAHVVYIGLGATRAEPAPGGEPGGVVIALRGDRRADEEPADDRA